MKRYGNNAAVSSLQASLTALTVDSPVVELETTSTANMEAAAFSTNRVAVLPETYHPPYTFGEATGTAHPHPHPPAVQALPAATALDASNMQANEVNEVLNLLSEFGLAHLALASLDPEDFGHLGVESAQDRFQLFLVKRFRLSKATAQPPARPIYTAVQTTSTRGPADPNHHADRPLDNLDTTVAETPAGPLEALGSLAPYGSPNRNTDRPLDNLGSSVQTPAGPLETLSSPATQAVGFCIRGEPLDVTKQELERFAQHNTELESECRSMRTAPAAAEENVAALALSSVELKAAVVSVAVMSRPTFPSVLVLGGAPASAPVEPNAWPTTVRSTAVYRTAPEGPQDRALYNAIRNNDPSVTAVTIPLSDEHETNFLLQVLQGNTVVDLVTFDMTWAFRAKMPILLQYLKQSESMRAFRLMDHLARIEIHPSFLFPFWSHSRAQDRKSIVCALAENPVPLHTFECDDRVSCDSLIVSLQAHANSIKNLFIRGRCIVFGPPPNDGSVHSFVQAISSLSALESLEVDVTVPGYELILENLCARPRPRKLLLVGYEVTHVNNLTCLTPLLQSGIVLETLALNGLNLDVDSMNSLVEGLVSCHSLETLYVGTFCRTDQTDHTGSAESALVHFFQTNHGIRQLYLSFLSEFFGATNMAASVLWGSEGATGSSLQAVGFDFGITNDAKDIIGVLTLLTESTSRLSSLTLLGLWSTAWLQLTQYLPRMVHLRNLALEFETFLLQKDDILHAFQSALRKNGSIHALSNAPDRFSAKEERRAAVGFDTGNFGFDRMQTYCDRNHLAPEWLQQVCLNQDGLASSGSQTLIPSLFKVVSQAPRTAPTIFLAGLLGLFDSIGPSECRF
jgi:hypothetical protein